MTQDRGTRCQLVRNYRASFLTVLITVSILSTGCETTKSSSVPDNLANDEVRQLDQEAKALSKFAAGSADSIADVEDLSAGLKGSTTSEIETIRKQLATAVATLRDARGQATALAKARELKRDDLLAAARANAEREREQTRRREAEEKRRAAEEKAALQAAAKQQRQLAKEKAALEKLRRQQESRRRQLQAEKEKREKALAEARAEAEAARKATEQRRQQELERIAKERAKHQQAHASEEQAAIADAERRLARLRDEFEQEQQRILGEKENAIAALAAKQKAESEDLAREEQQLQESLAAQEERVQSALIEAQRREAEVAKLIKVETQEWSANLRALEGKLKGLQQANKTYLIREIVVTGDRESVRSLPSWSGYQGYANQELAVGDIEAIRSRLARDLRNAGHQQVSVEISEPSLDLGFLKFRVATEK